MQWDEEEGVLRGIVKVDVTKTSNDWLVGPAISGWAYGESPVLSEAQAKFGDVKVGYTGTANDGTQWDGAFPLFKAGSYVATYTVDETANYEGLKVEIPFTVARADLDMSQVKWDYEAPFAYDGSEHAVRVEGLPNGVKVEGYTGNVATEIGDYTAKVELSYDQDNCNAPAPVQDLSWSIVAEASAGSDGEDAEKPGSGKDSAKDKDPANLLKKAKSATVPTGDELPVTAPLASLALGSLVVALAVRHMRDSF